MSKGRDIRGLTIEIGGDTTGLQKSLKNVNSDIKTTQAQLKDMENTVSSQYNSEKICLIIQRR